MSGITSDPASSPSLRRQLQRLRRLGTIWAQPSLSRDFALLSMVIVFIVAMVGTWISWQTYVSHSEKILSVMEGETARIDRTLILQIDNTSYLLESLGRQIIQVGPTNVEGVQQLLKSFDVNPELYSLFTWVNNEQHIVATSRGRPRTLNDVSDRDYAKRALAEPWRIQIGRPVEGRVSNRWIMPMAIGLTDFSGKYLGAVVISLDISGFTREIFRLINNPSISFAIVSKNLIPLTQVSGGENLFNTQFSMQRLAGIDFDKAPEGILARGTLLGGGVYTRYATSSKYPYLILMSYDPRLSEHSITADLLPRLLQVFFVGLSLVVMLWFLRLRIIRPVIELSAAAAKIARGKRHVSVPTGGPQEIEQLCQQVQKIHRYIEERKLIEDELRSKQYHYGMVREQAELKLRAMQAFFNAIRDDLSESVNLLQDVADQIAPLDMDETATKTLDEACGHLEELIRTTLQLNDTYIIPRAIDEQHVDVPEVIRLAIRMLSAKASQKEIVLKLRDGNALPIHANRLIFFLIMVVVLSSILSVMEPTGFVSIEARPESQSPSGDYLVIITYSGLSLVAEETTRMPSQHLQAVNSMTPHGETTPPPEDVERQIAVVKDMLTMQGFGMAVSANTEAMSTTVTLLIPAERIAG